MKILACLFAILICINPSIGISSEQGVLSYQLSGKCGVKDRSFLAEGEFPVTYHNIVVVDSDMVLDSEIYSCDPEDLGTYVDAATNAARNRSGLTNLELQRWRFSNPLSLEAKKCSLLAHENSDGKLLLLRSKLNAKLPDKVRGYELLSMFWVEKDTRPNQLLGQFISEDRLDDLRRDFSVKFLCNFDRDNFAEIIVIDRRYAGYDFSVCDFDSSVTSFKCTPYKTATVHE